MQKKQSEFENINQPQVSVVIPAYNQAHYLTLAISSVLAQTFRDFEVIVVDDGSTDDTPLKAQQFGDVIRYIYQDNQGLAGTRNTGICQARGEYIAFLDSDDEWTPTFLETMMSLVAQYPDAAVYYSGACYMDADGRELPQLATSQVVPPEAMYQTLLRANFLNCCAVLVRRSVAIDAGLFDLAFRRLQDWEFWLRLLRAGHTFIGCPDPLVYYRLHGSSLSTDPVGGKQAALAIVEKHFGPDDGQRQRWSAEKRRAYGGAYRYHALTSLLRQKEWQACTAYLRRALQVDPTLAVDLALFYELALGTQPLGYRGTPHQLDQLDSASNIKTMLADIFHSEAALEGSVSFQGGASFGGQRTRLASPVASELALLRRQTYGTAYYALGLVAYNMGQFSRSRRFLLNALRFRHDLWRDSRLTSTLMKSFVGRSTLDWLRRWHRIPIRQFSRHLAR